MRRLLGVFCLLPLLGYLFDDTATRVVATICLLIVGGCVIKFMLPASERPKVVSGDEAKAWLERVRKGES